jgi:hypothetical protein
MSIKILSSSVSAVGILLLLEKILFIICFTSIIGILVYMFVMLKEQRCVLLFNLILCRSFIKLMELDMWIELGA